MKHFYAFMLFCSRFELAAARRYSTNRAYISTLTCDVEKWEGLFLKCKIKETLS